MGNMIVVTISQDQFAAVAPSGHAAPAVGTLSLGLSQDEGEAAVSCQSV